MGAVVAAVVVVGPVVLVGPVALLIKTGTTATAIGANTGKAHFAAVPTNPKSSDQKPNESTELGMLLAYRSAKIGKPYPPVPRVGDWDKPVTN